MPRWSKITLKVFAIFVALVFLIYVGLATYVNANQKKLLTTVTEQLNKNLNGTLTIGGMNSSFLKGFPGVSLSLKNVILKDSLWDRHKHNLLEAKDFDVSVNVLGLLRGDIDIEKIGINNSTIYLFTDSNGYSNTAVFKNKKQQDKPAEKGSVPAKIRHIILNNVDFVVDNKRGHKLFHFVIDELKGKMDYPLSGGWKADVRLKTLAKSLTFNTSRGSFIKDKLLEGPFKISYDADTDTHIVDVAPNKLNIGNDLFIIGGRFDTSKENTDFTINIEAPNILWKSAAGLLAPNITMKLNMFNLDKPIHAKCTLKGNMGAGGDPLIDVAVLVRDNVLTTPGGVVDDCNFNGTFTNNYVNGKGLGDENSIIKLYQFKGSYKEIPFLMDTVFINNLEKPIARGKFTSQFEIAKLNNIVGQETLKFGKGTANVNLTYTADIVNFQLAKPLVSGSIAIKNADVNYVPRKLSFNNTAILLNFANNDLFIKNIRLQSGKSVVLMDGVVRNFLNLYYTAPEKILLTWKIRSPQIHLAEFLGFLGSRSQAAKARSKQAKQTTISEDLNTVFEKSNVNMHLNVDKVYYNKFLATNAIADLQLSESGIAIKNVSLKHAGGSLKLNGNVSQKGGLNRFTVNTILSNVDIQHFFYSFDNFGMKTLTSKNLKGYLFSKTNISGGITDQGKLVTSSMMGSLLFDLKKGALLNFDPIINVGKFAFPFRDLNNITFDNLNGKFDIRGQKITINPMEINSSLLNMDVAGVYSLSTGTNIALDVPLRNPKKDADITDAAEKKARRMKGIVLHLLATDGEDGKIKIKLNRNRKASK
ncbi:MAG: AsmA-like C-terminal region-containing protein [Candidatus Pedobacter colombiensis]|uniref:AsmA-like C-terminal region-containing protein n=1 Tax=Candidatus Pedobacter colombiensis TaxID=3121371 RepID=A0AAJ5WDR2_9SPHI|nr:AsmA-like C-terminal region-containing protein [Pedobacter sp.]WEK21716.1 MAG: AsmA-like C-terminal region-containing protein [Pedobacter sp.]